MRHIEPATEDRSSGPVAYGLVDIDTRVAAVAALSALSLPVASPRDMKKESVPTPHALMPPTRSRAKR
jgi:hypothetical protein